MKPSSYITVIALLLLSFLLAGRASAQECLTLEVSCSPRMPGDSAPLRCSANVEGDAADANLIYQWSVSPPSPLKPIAGRPDEIEIDLSGNPNQRVRVTLIMRGVPKECQDTAEFESLPIKPDNFQLEQRPPEAISSNPPANSSSITGTCSESVPEGATAYFSVNLSGAEQGLKPVYNWKVSRGQIKSGQGTAAIAVSTTDLGGDIVTATAQVEGLNAPLRVSCSTMIKGIPKAYKLAEINNQGSDEATARLRRFALRLNIGLEEQAYIVAIGRRGQSLQEAEKRAERARDYLINQCDVDPNRILGISVGFGNDEAIQLWVIQTGAALPQSLTKIR